MRSLTTRRTFVDIFILKASFLWDAILVIGFACLTAVFAQISFWVGMVPVTGQTLGVLLAGAFLGSRRGALSQISYLAIGVTGIPYWFALGGPPGIARLVGPTGGYLIGFVAVAFVVGWLTERGWDRHILRAALAMLAGDIVLYIFGLTWLAHFVPKSTVLQIGLYPFIVGDLLKIAVAAFVLSSGWLFVRPSKN